MTLIRLITKKPQFQNQFNKAMLKRLGAKLNSSVDAFTKILQDVVEKTIKSTDVWRSLEGDSEQGLDAHFGIRASENSSRLDEILEFWKSQIRVTYKTPYIYRNGYRFGVRLEAIEKDWSKIASLEAGQTLSEPSGETLAWLDWLLTGNISLSPSISDYKIEFDLVDDNQVRKSRSGKALMVLSETDSYKFPNDIAGVTEFNNNFITRAFETTVTENRKLLKQKFIEAIKRAL